MSTAATKRDAAPGPGSRVRVWVAAGIMSSALPIVACTRSSCENRAFYGLPSPDGRYIAFIFHRTCPAPEGVSTQVSLMPFHDSLRGAPGNVLSVAGEQPVTVSWKGTSTLRVAGFKDAAFQSRAPIAGISIEFP